MGSEPMSGVAMVAEMEVMHGLSSVNFHSPRLAWLQIMLSTRSTKIRDQH